MEPSSAIDSLDAMMSQSPLGMRHNELAPASLKCCCGRPQCAYLEHNTIALECLEKDLRSAAQIGQALLARHEANMREAEAERLRMGASIEKLETEKRELEATNAKASEENRYLLDQLEELNNTVTESDAHIQSLTATLQTTRQELQKLTVLAGRTAQLEAQLSAMELEQSALQTQLISTEEESKSAIQRWKRAERTIEQLQDQVDRIEREAREERERHVEVLGRMERQRAVEKELESATGRLKGAAAISTLGRNQPAGTSVVSHFVRDILQDNANLQMGIVELREMLMGSNAEVESLREQMLLHHDGEVVDKEATLKAELLKCAPSEPPQELHVHHHYHAPEVRTVRKPKKKRVAIAPGHFLPSSGTSTPRTARIREWRATPPSSAATIMSQTSASVPSMQMAARQERQSMQSDQSGTSFAPSSVPSSPGSVFRSSSVFDNIDGLLDSSRPTSPDCSSVGSPMFLPKDQSRNPKSSYRNFSTPTPLKLKSSAPTQLSISAHRGSLTDSLPDMTDSSITPLSELSIPEESERDMYNFQSPYLEEDSATTDTPTTIQPNRPSLRRAASHESLISISGMDIHTLHDRPSQMFTGRGFSPRNPYSQFSPTTSTTSIVSPTTAHARPALQRQEYGSSSSDYNRSILSAHARSNADDKSTLGKLVGGWVWGKKGVVPMASAGDLRAKAVVSPVEVRSPGVNQSGPIKGFRLPPRPPSEIEPQKVDTGLLREAVEGG
ncbi:hypothetical protein MMC30_006089 [Trapelia coarctata]|nr:hypothetical protein [Trapelia coarctata]